MMAAQADGLSHEQGQQASQRHDPETTYLDEHQNHPVPERGPESGCVYCDQASDADRGHGGKESRGDEVIHLAGPRNGQHQDPRADDDHRKERQRHRTDRMQQGNLQALAFPPEFLQKRVAAQNGTLGCGQSFRDARHQTRSLGCFNTGSLSGQTVSITTRAEISTDEGPAGRKPAFLDESLTPAR